MCTGLVTRVYVIYCDEDSLLRVLKFNGSCISLGLVSAIYKSFGWDDC